MGSHRYAATERPTEGASHDRSGSQRDGILVVRLHPGHHAGAGEHGELRGRHGAWAQACAGAMDGPGGRIPGRVRCVVRRAVGAGRNSAGGVAGHFRAGGGVCAVSGLQDVAAGARRRWRAGGAAHVQDRVHRAGHEREDHRRLPCGVLFLCAAVLSRCRVRVAGRAGDACCGHGLQPGLAGRRCDAERLLRSAPWRAGQGHGRGPGPLRRIHGHDLRSRILRPFVTRASLRDLWQLRAARRMRKASLRIHED